MQNGDLKNIELVLNESTTKNRANAYVTATDEFGMTALHHATKSVLIPDAEYLPIVDQLIEYAADKKEYVTMADQKRKTALHYAATKANAEVVGRLINEAGDMGEDRDKYITAQDSEKKTALHWAARRKRFEIVETLLNLSQDRLSHLNRQCHRGRTALHYAVIEELPFYTIAEDLFVYTVNEECCGVLRNESINIILFLLRQLIDPAIPDEQGNTAWDICFASQLFWKWEAISAFIMYECMAGQLEFGMEATLPNNAQIYFIANKLREKSALSGDIETIKIMAKIISQVERTLNYNMEVYPRLISREPSCIAERVDYSEDPKPKSCDFVSLVIPVIDVNNWSVITTRMVDHNNNLLKACVGKNHDSLKACMPLTLDEYCNPALPDKILEDRNFDQVLGRYEEFKKERDGSTQTQTSYNKDPPALLGDLRLLMGACMRKLRHLIGSIFNNQQPTRTAAERIPPENAVFIRQACIWKIDNPIIVPSNEDPHYRTSVWSSGVFIASLDESTGFVRILLDSLGNSLRGGFEPLLKTYENALSLISENVNQYVKKARVEDIDLEKEKQLCHEISDLQEELPMIKSVLAEQEEVRYGQMKPSFSSKTINHAPDKTAITEHSRRYHLRAGLGKIASSKQRQKEKQSQPQKPKESKSGEIMSLKTTFDKYRRRITKLEQDAERVEQDVLIQLDLKQRHATMKEAHSVAVLSATVFGLTIITVIFAPLSFVVALFALPIDQFNEGKAGNDKDGVYSFDYIRNWSVTIEFATIFVTLAAMWAALRFTGLHIWGVKGPRESIRKKANKIRTTNQNLRKTDTEMAINT
ncbi:hypothetical protein RRF57_013403 [Xylaria bambusicola]|uniref:PGG domain-containing protein n=1 Tax=Xylaria bambusicola TaxID=326684 RepID=A0AAN7ZFF4_9PEZI